MLVRGIDLPDDMVEGVHEQAADEVLLVSLIRVVEMLMAANAGSKISKQDRMQELSGLAAALTIKLDQLFPEA